MMDKLKVISEEHENSRDVRNHGKI